LGDDEIVGFGDGLNRTSHCENTFMDTWDDFADASLDPSLISQIRDVFSSLPDDDAGVLGADECT
jgi:hypothetical protein